MSSSIRPLLVRVQPVLNAGVGDPGCDGFQLCLVTNASNPFVDLGSNLVINDLLADAHASVVSVPVPASLWFFLASALVGYGPA